MFPGVVSAPFSVVKLGPDVRDNGVDGYSGYQPQGNINGFSMTHESGTGGAPKYGVVSHMPVIGKFQIHWMTSRFPGRLQTKQRLENI